MIITTRSGNKYMVKIRFIHTPVIKESTDEYGRKHVIYWTEHSTRVSVSRLTTAKVNSEVTITGISRCHYKDKFDKLTGKKIAYNNAITKLYDLSLITAEDRIDLAAFDLVSADFVAPQLNTCEQEAKI